MKTDLPFHSPFPSTRNRPARFAAVMIVLATVAFAAEESSAPAHKEYNMFVGADLEVLKDKKIHPVVSAAGRVLDVKVGTELKRYQIDEVQDLRAKPTLKLSRTLANIANFKCERTYSSEADPVKSWARQATIAALLAAGNQGYGSDQGAVSVRSLHGGGNGTASTSGPAMALPGGSIGAWAGRNMYSDMMQSAAGPGMLQTVTHIQDYVPSSYSPEHFIENLTGELGAEKFDAIDIQLELTAEKHIPDAYLVIVCDITDPEKPGKPSRWIHIKTLDDIDDRKQTVRIKQIGFPVGYKIEHTSLHVYSRGQEVATNQAERRMEMTRDDAHEYLNIQYFTTHKNATRAPALALAELPKGFYSRVGPNFLKQELTLHLDADGKVLTMSATGDELDPYMMEVVRGFRFNPALANGLPVETTFKTSLASLLK